MLGLPGNALKSSRHVTLSDSLLIGMFPGSMQEFFILFYLFSLLWHRFHLGNHFEVSSAHTGLRQGGAQPQYTAKQR